MKTISILLILGAFVLGMYDGGDVTGAIVLLFIFGPSIFERKSHRKKGAGGTFLGGIEQRELRQ